MEPTVIETKYLGVDDSLKTTFGLSLLKTPSGYFKLTLFTISDTNTEGIFKDIVREIVYSFRAKTIDELLPLSAHDTPKEFRQAVRDMIYKASEENALKALAHNKASDEIRVRHEAELNAGVDPTAAMQRATEAYLSLREGSALFKAKIDTEKNIQNKNRLIKAGCHDSPDSYKIKLEQIKAILAS
jgi:hypothetical protein